MNTFSLISTEYNCQLNASTLIVQVTLFNFAVQLDTKLNNKNYFWNVHQVFIVLQPVRRGIQLQEEATNHKSE